MRICILHASSKLVNSFQYTYPHKQQILQQHAQNRERERESLARYLLCRPEISPWQACPSIGWGLECFPFSSFLLPAAHQQFKTRRPESIWNEQSVYVHHVQSPCLVHMHSTSLLTKSTLVLTSMQKLSFSEAKVRKFSDAHSPITWYGMNKQPVDTIALKTDIGLHCKTRRTRVDQTQISLAFYSHTSIDSKVHKHVICVVSQLVTENTERLLGGRAAEHFILKPQLALRDMKVLAIAGGKKNSILCNLSYPIALATMSTFFLLFILEIGFLEG